MSNLKNYCIGKQIFKKLEDSLQSHNRREIQKNILKLGKSIFLRTSCASSQPLLDQGFPAISLPASKMAKEVKYDVLSLMWRRIWKQFLNSAVGVEH